MLGRMLSEKSHVLKAILIVSKDIRLTISALRHMMGATRHNNPRSSWHVFSWVATAAGGAIRRATSIKGLGKFTACRSPQKEIPLCHSFQENGVHARALG